MKEIIYNKYGERKENESPAEYIRKINKLNADNIGFIEYHKMIWAEMKKIVFKEEYQFACSQVTGYEKEWVTCIYELLKNNKI